MSELVQKVIRVPENDARWFEETYPAYGSWTWFIQTVLRHFREAHETSPDDIVSQAARRTLEDSGENHARRADTPDK